MTGRDGRKRKKHSTSLPKKYHRNAIICTSSTGTFPLAFSHERPLSQQSVPRSTWRYQDICVHIYRWCVCALNARQYATLPRLTPTERHVVMYDVWVFLAHRSLCAALPDLTATSVVQFCDCSSAQRTVSMLSTLLFRMSVSLKKLYHSSEKGLPVHVINHRGCKTGNASMKSGHREEYEGNSSFALGRNRCLKGKQGTCGLGHWKGGVQVFSDTNECVYMCLTSPSHWNSLRTQYHIVVEGTQSPVYRNGTPVRVILRIRRTDSSVSEREGKG